MSIFEKIYNRINWQNKPSTETPINADNLNKMDKAIDDLDNRVVSLSESVDTNTTDISDLQTDVSANSKKLATIDDGANKTVVDSVLSSTSTNPVQNKVVNDALIKYVSNYYDTVVTTHGQQFIVSSNIVASLVPTGKTLIGSMCRLTNGNTSLVSNIFSYGKGWVVTIDESIPIGTTMTWNIIVLYI